MQIKKVLEKLTGLFKKWRVPNNEWILTAQYAFKLLGYDVKVRKGHLNILIKSPKIPWEIKGELETHPPKNTKFSKQFNKFIKQTEFEFDLVPISPKDFRRKVKNTIEFSLPNSEKILIQNPCGALEELDYLLSMCTEEGWGKEKGARVLPSVEDQQKALLMKGEKEMAKSYGHLIQKYSYLKKTKISRVRKGIKTLSGVPASKGHIKGKVRIILDPNKIRDFRKGDILVSSVISPKFTSVILRAKAVVTDEGGMLCHAAIISREIGIPCVVGTKTATSILKNDIIVVVNGDKGIVRLLR